MIVVWYLCAQAVALAALPLTWSAFRRLDDRGYAVRHALGLLVVGFLFWIGYAAGVLRAGRVGACVALAATALISLAALGSSPQMRLKELLEWLRVRRRLVLAHELGYLLLFALWSLVRAHSPAIAHTEQPMDLMLLAAVGSDPDFPPGDPWLAGAAIGYYAFGAWLAATLMQLAAAPPEIAYNLAQATWFALAGSTAFGVGFHLAAESRAPVAADTEGTEGAAPAELRQRTLGGLWAAFLVVGAANFDGTVRAWRALFGAPGAGDSWWWFGASRVASDRAADGAPLTLIQEFPAFSFVLGDNHAHLLALPFVLLAVLVSLHLRRIALELPPEQGAGPSSSEESRSSAVAIRAVAARLRATIEGGSSGAPWAAAWVVALVAAVPLAISSWDLPLVWSLLAIPAWIAGAGATRRAPEGAALHGLLGVAMLGLALAATTVALLFPYVLSAESQARGFLPNLFHPSAPLPLLAVFGAFLPALLALLVPSRPLDRGALLAHARATWTIGAGALGVLLVGGAWAGASERGRLWLAAAAPEQGALTLALERWTSRPFVLVALAALLALALGRARSGRLEAEPSGSSPLAGELGFTRALAALGLLALLLPELVFVHDLFGHRMNTVFKLHFEAWVLFALAGSAAIARLGGRPGVRGYLVRLSAALLLASAAYPVAAIRARSAEWAGAPTLDGLAAVGADERAAIDWIRSSTRPGDVVLQTVGTSYRAEESRISAVTGRATLLGWRDHERQWRGDRFEALADGREEAIDTIYRSGDAPAIAATAERWSIDYLYLGPLERARHGVDAEREAVIAGAAELVFARGEIRIFRIAQSAERSTS